MSIRHQKCLVVCVIKNEWEGFLSFYCEVFTFLLLSCCWHNNLIKKLNNRSEEYKLADSAMEVEDNKENVDQKDEDIIGEFNCLLLIEVAITNIRILKTAAITR